MGGGVGEALVYKWLDCQVSYSNVRYRREKGKRRISFLQMSISIYTVYHAVTIHDSFCVFYPH